MSSFRPGLMPQGVSVQRPAWQRLDAATPSASPFSPSPPSAAAIPRVSGPEELLNEARLQAAQILQDAAAEAEMAQEEAGRQGFDQGRQEGLEAARAELEALQHQAEALVAEARTRADLVRQAAEAEARAMLADTESRAQQILARSREEAAALVAEGRAEQHRRLDEAHRALVDLAVTAAMRLVQGHLALQPQSVTTMVAAGLRKLKDTDCLVRVSTQDLPLLEAQRSTLERELGAGLLRLQPDMGLSSGSFIVSSPQGVIDARLEQQGQHLRAALDAALGGSAD